MFKTDPYHVTARAPGLLPGAEPFLYEAGDETGCVLVHGFTSTPWEMRGFGRYLADRGITAGAPLLAGHGTSPEDLRATGWRDWAASVSLAIDDMQRRCRRVYVAGLSLGGMLTLYTAAKRGDDLAGIAAIATPVYYPEGLGLMLEATSHWLLYLHKWFRDVQDPAARARHVSYRRVPVRSMASVVGFSRVVRDLLPRVQVPAVVIYPRHDHVVAPFNSRIIYSHIGSTDKSIIELERGYHIATVDNDREKVYASIHNFIEEREQQAELCYAG